MNPTLIQPRRPVAVVRPADTVEAVLVHWAASPCTLPGRVTGQPGEVTCDACITWTVEAAWKTRNTRTGVA